MPKKKLILICQFGGEFETSADGSLSYNGGDANAVDINHETMFDGLKLKLAEMFDLELKSLSMKYFLPGNRRTLITLANDKDLKRMFDFHNDSITADVFLAGQRGFVRENPPVRATRPGRKKRAQTVPVEEFEDAADDLAVDPAGDTTAQSSNVLDMNCSPADTVKKRRRTASWKVGANGPTIVSVAEKGPATKRSTRKKNFRNLDDTMVDVVVEERPDFEPMMDMSFYSSNCKDGALEDKIATWKEGIVGVGQDFDSVVEFREALQKYAIAHRFVYRLKKNDTNRASGICVVAGCSWSIHASWVQSAGVFRIKKMNRAHTCGGESWKAAHPKKGWLINIIKDRLRENPHDKPKDIARGIFHDFGIKLNYTQVWRGIDEARGQLQGSYKQAYTRLPWFCNKMVEANPGSVVNLCVGDDDNKFQRLFVSFRASINGFRNGCRPLIFLDSTPLKSKYYEVLLTATGVDGNDDAFPISFAIVDVENEDNWKWFLEQLKSAISMEEPITFVSDNEKGLMKSVVEVFEHAHFGYSISHLLENFRISLRGPFQGDGKGTLPVSLLGAAHAVRLDSFRMFMDQIKQVSSKAYDWLMQFQPEHWTNALFKGERYIHIADTMEDLYADWIEEMRELPILQKVEELGCKIMDLMQKRQTDSNGWSTTLAPTKEKKLNEEALKALPLRVLFSSDTLFEVHDDSINVVDLLRRDCTCQQWKLTGLPCSHAIAVFNRIGKSAYNHCSKYFTADSFRATYAESINPVADIFKLGNEEDEVEKEDEDEEENEDEEASGAKQVLPPTTPRPPIQLKDRHSRRKCELKRVMTCTRCKGEGHNKATCKEPLTDISDQAPLTNVSDEAALTNVSDEAVLTNVSDEAALINVSDEAALTNISDGAE
ncbi:hypothetical protein M5689_011567 [Euphorbia peplus]|nr:hypothetical protein M5689_011567 [Euphorbia peplus]